MLNYKEAQSNLSLSA